MDQGKLVEKIRKIFNKIIMEHGNINIAMILPDKKIDTFTIIISSKWLDDMSPYEGTKLIATYFFSNLENDEFQKISRINLVNTKDENLNLIYKAVKIKGSIVNVQNCIFFNVRIDKVIIMEAHED